MKIKSCSNLKTFIILTFSVKCFHFEINFNFNFLYILWQNMLCSGKSRLKAKHYFSSFSLWKITLFGAGDTESGEEMGLRCAETKEILKLQESHHMKGFSFCTTAHIK